LKKTTARQLISQRTVRDLNGNGQHTNDTFNQLYLLQKFVSQIEQSRGEKKKKMNLFITNKHINQTSD